MPSPQIASHQHITKGTEWNQEGFKLRGKEPGEKSA